MKIYRLAAPPIVGIISRAAVSAERKIHICANFRNVTWLWQFVLFPFFLLTANNRSFGMNRASNCYTSLRNSNCGGDVRRATVHRLTNTRTVRKPLFVVRMLVRAGKAPPDVGQVRKVRVSDRRMLSPSLAACVPR